MRAPKLPVGMLLLPSLPAFLLFASCADPGPDDFFETGDEPAGRGPVDPELFTGPPLGTISFGPTLDRFDDVVDEDGRPFDFVARNLRARAFLGRMGLLMDEPFEEPLRMRFVGGRPLELREGERFDFFTNQLLGTDFSAFVTGVPGFREVRADDVWPGIDVVFQNAGGNIEVLYEVSPGADPNQIAMAFDGAQDVFLASNGDVVIRVGDDSLRLLAPQAFQEVGELIEDVPVSYQVAPGGLVTLQVGQYDRSRPLLIDPVLDFASIMEPTLRDVAVSEDRVYVVGYGRRSNNLEDERPAEQTDAFIAALSRQGGELLAVTWLGGSEADQARAVAVDDEGRVYVTGGTRSADFPTTPGALRSSFPEGHVAGRDSEVFVLRLSPDLERIEWSTYFGASERAGAEENLEIGVALALAPDGNVVVGARSFGGADMAEVPAGDRGEVLLFSLADDGRVLEWARRYGGVACAPEGGEGLDGSTILEDLDVDPDGNVVFVGRTRAVGLPTVNAAQEEHANRPALCGADEEPVGADGFAAKLSGDGERYLYSTYLGGELADAATAVASDAVGRAVVAGTSDSLDFISTRLVDNASPPDRGAFLLTLGCEGELERATRIGSGAPQGVALEPDGSVVVVGTALGEETLVTPVQAERGSRVAGDGLLQRFSPDLTTLTFATYLGGEDEDALFAVAARDGEWWAVGATRSRGLFDSSRMHAFSADTGGIVVALMAPFDAHFTAPGADDRLLVAEVEATEPLETVEARVNEGDWQRLEPVGESRYELAVDVPPASEVRFRAFSRGGGVAVSERFLWPYGARFPDTAEGFEARFLNVRGNEYWVETDVAANGALERVEVLTMTGEWLPLEETAWGSWATSFFIPDGSLVRLRAVSRCGQSFTSQAYRWPDGAPADASEFDAAFKNPRGNAWWVEIEVGASEPVLEVQASVDGGPFEPLSLTEWSTWADNRFVPDGADVRFRAVAEGGGTATSMPMAWPPGEPHD